MAATRGIAVDDGLDRAAAAAGRRCAGSGCRRPGRASGTPAAPAARGAWRETSPEDVERVDLVAIGPADRPGERARADDAARGARAPRRSATLESARPRMRRLRVEDHRRRDHRSRERAAARFIDAGDARRSASTAHRRITRSPVRTRESRPRRASRAAAAQRLVHACGIRCCSSCTCAGSPSSRSSASPRALAGHLLLEELRHQAAARRAGSVAKSIAP